ncbi:MAG: hypothetical protein EU531_07070 [Promethearchaeota archaeon]|nr:MAG: hypothetical protein EU531_07070 [Candidatus Lokiarchaeota archaeon]
MMIDSNRISTILQSLESTDEQFKTSIDKIIKIGLTIANNSKDFKDELRCYDDFICHVYIKDLDFNIWVNHNQQTLSYNTNYYENHSNDNRIIHFIMKKEILKKIFHQKMYASEAYMKGFIEIEGTLADAMIIKNVLRYFFKLYRYLIS